MVFFLLSLRHVVDAVGNPKTIVGFVLLELLGKCCHLVPDDDDLYIIGAVCISVSCDEKVTLQEKFTHENCTLPTIHLGPAGRRPAWAYDDNDDCGDCDYDDYDE